MSSQTATRVVPKYKKIYFDEDTMAFVNESKRPSKLVNMAVAHMKVHMNKLIADVNLKFDDDEIDVILDMFYKRVLPKDKTDYIYFWSIEEAREMINYVNESTAHMQNAVWKRVVPILLKRCELAELNCFLYLAKFGSQEISSKGGNGAELS